jgi:hypothetical protein
MPEVPSSSGSEIPTEVGPSWMRPDSEGLQPPTDPTPINSETRPDLAGAPMPWQVPSDQPQTSVPEVASTAGLTAAATMPAAEHHGFPIMIFVVLVIATIVAIGIFLFANGSLPGA